MDKSIVAERIKTAREALGITMAEASRQLNLSKIGYCRYEYGERTPSPQTLEVIARCFHTSVDYLTGRTDVSEPDSLVISRSEEPLLFELASSYRNYSDDQKERLLSFVKLLSE